MDKDPDYKVELDEEAEEEEEEEEEAIEEETAASGAPSTRSSRSRSVPGRVRKTSSGETVTDRSSSLRSTRLSVNPDFAAKHRRFLNSVSGSLEDDGNGKRAGRSRDRSEKNPDKPVGHAGRSRQRSAKSASRAGKSQDRSGKLPDKPVAKSQDSSEKISDKLVTRKSSQDESDKKPVTKLQDTNDKSTGKPGGRSSQDSCDKILDKLSVKSLDSSDKNTDKTVRKSPQDGSDRILENPAAKSKDSADTSTDKTVTSSQEDSDKILEKSAEQSQDSSEKSTDKTVKKSQNGSDKKPNEPENNTSGEITDADDDDDDDDDNTPLRAIRSRSRVSETRKRGREEDEGEEEKEKEVEEERKEVEEESPKRKKRALDKTSDAAPKPIREGKDMYCWKCHREGTAVACIICPRVFHLRCLHLDTTPPFDWVCPECSTTLYAENIETRSPAMKSLTLDQLCNLLKFTLARMNSYPGSEWFIKPVDTNVFKDYRNFVVNPMDLSYLEKNIKQKVYGSTHAFYADTQWLLHNSVIFNSHQSKMSNIAKVLVKICKQELDEIETCPECYLNAHTRKDSWFIEACKRPHILVWAKLKGFPFWPAKAMKTNADNLVDVRFFGAHDRAWIPIKFVYLYSKLNPCSSKNRRKSQFDDCILEVQQHIKKLRDRFGEFVYPPFKCSFDANKEEEQLEAMLPGYKAASRRYGKLLGPFRNFSSPSTISHIEVKKELSDSAKRKLSPEKSKRKADEDNLSSQNSSKSSDNNDYNKDKEEENNDDSGKKRGVEGVEGKKTETQTLSPKSDANVKSNTDPTRGGAVTCKSSIQSVSVGEGSGNKENGDKNVEKETKKRNDNDDDDEPLAKRLQLDETGKGNKKTPEKSPIKTDYAASLQEKLQLMLKKEAVDSLESNSKEMADGDEVEEEVEEDEEKKKKENEKNVVSKSGDVVGDADLGSTNDDTTTEKEKNTEDSEKGSKESEKDSDKDKEKNSMDEERVTKDTNDEKKVDNDKGKDSKESEKGSNKDKEEVSTDKENYTIICKKEVEDKDDSSCGKEVEGEEEEEEKEAHVEQSATPHIDLTTDDDDDDDAPPQRTDKSKCRVMVCDLKHLADRIENVSNDGTSKVVVEQTKPKVLDTISATIEEVVQNSSLICSRKIEATKKLTGIVDNLNQFSKGMEKLSRNSSITIAKTESVIDCDDEDDLDIDNPRLISLLKARDPNCCSPEEMERVLPPNRRKGFPSKVRRNASTASSTCSSDLSSVEELKRICAEQELRGENDRKRPSTTPIEDLTDDSYSVLDEVSGQFMKKRMEKGNVTITLVSDDESSSNKPSTNKSQLKGSVSLSKDVSLSIVRDDTKNPKDLSLDMECVESDTDDIENAKNRSGRVSSNNSIQVKPTARKSFPNAPSFGNKTMLTKTRDGGSEMTRRLSAADRQVMNQQNGGGSSSSAKVSPIPSPKNQTSASSAFYSKISKIAANAPGSEEVQISNTMSLKIHAVEPSSATKSITVNKSSPPTAVPLTAFNVVSTSSLSATVAPTPSTSSSASSSRPLPTAVTQAARVLPQLQLKPPAPPTAASTSAAGRSLLRGNFGPATGRMDAMSQRLSENMMQMMEDMLHEMAQEGRFEARLKQMQLELERTQWKYRQEMAEYKHNTDLMIMEMRAGFEAERHRAIMEVRMKCQAEKEAAINETKMKQWCALCKKEALFYCCWNTAYCNYPCQQEHWPQHMANCAQTNRANQEAAAKTTSSVKMLTAPFATTTTTAGQKTVSIPPTQSTSTSVSNVLPAVGQTYPGPRSKTQAQFIRQNHLQVAATATLMTSSSAVATQESNNKSLMQQNNSLVPLHHALPPTVTMSQHQVNSAGGMRMMRAPVMVRPPMNFTIRPPQHFMVTPQGGPLPHPSFFQ